MRTVLTVDRKGRLFENQAPTTISRVITKYGIEAMLALERGETVHILTETEEDQKNDRPGS